MLNLIKYTHMHNPVCVWGGIEQEFKQQISKIARGNTFVACHGSRFQVIQVNLIYSTEACSNQ